MIIEALSFKLALDFFKYLEKNRVYSTEIKIDFFDRIRHEYYDFANVAAMQEYWESNYIPIDNCFLGDLGGISFFRSTSDTYNFETNYKAIDVIGNYELVPGAAFDIQRNAQRKVFKERQKNFIDKTVAEYRAFYNELKFIYVTGIYSPCYAEPGWSENTWYLASLRDALAGVSNSSQFPYSNAVIEKKPPE